jgi:hypothetical protein
LSTTFIFSKEFPMNDVVTTSEVPLPDRDNDLARLAACANEAHHKVAGAIQQAVLHALQAGQALLEAKRLCKKGTWTGWLKANFRASARTAQGYMRLAVHWTQVGGDPQSIADLNYSKLTRLLTGLARADGRVNHPRSTAQKRLTALEVTVPAVDSDPSATAAAPRTPVAQPPAPAAANDDPFGVVAVLLEHTVAELRRLVAGDPKQARYARHLMQPLERIRVGLATRRWFWDMIKR